MIQGVFLGEHPWWQRAFRPSQTGNRRISVPALSGLPLYAADLTPKVAENNKKDLYMSEPVCDCPESDSVQFKGILTDFI